ncbi:MAG: polyprenyl diphosphate synthase, partial [Fusobacteriaceae bacterium]
KFIISGRKDNVSEELLKSIDDLREKTKNNTGITLNLAFNYGGRAEIVDAVNKILEKKLEKIDEKIFSEYLYNPIPDPELLIRTSGEIRISNFLLWQIAYSEIYVTEKLWPEFDEKELEKAIESYQNRDRRFGGVKTDVK